MSSKGILFYRESSPNCIETINLLNEWNINSIGLVSVDNEKVQRYLENNDEIRIRTLPALAIMSRGSMTVLEQRDLANWLAAVISTIIKSRPQASAPQQGSPNGGFVSLISQPVVREHPEAYESPMLRRGREHHAHMRLNQSEPLEEEQERDQYEEYYDSRAAEDHGIAFEFPSGGNDDPRMETIQQMNQRQPQRKVVGRRKINARKVMALAAGEDWESEEETEQADTSDNYNRDAIRRTKESGGGVKFQFPHQSAPEEEPDEYQEEEELPPPPPPKVRRQKQDDFSKETELSEEYATSRLPINKQAKGRGIKFEFESGNKRPPKRPVQRRAPSPVSYNSDESDESPPPSPKRVPVKPRQVQRKVYSSSDGSDNDDVRVSLPPRRVTPQPVKKQDSDTEFDLDSDTEETYPKGTGGGRISAPTVPLTPGGRMTKQR